MDLARPPAVAFDVLGTLFSLEVLREQVTSLGAPPQALELWFAQALRDFFAASHSGRYTPLAAVLESALPRALRAFGVLDVDGGALAAAASATGRLEPAPGAHQACSALAGAGVPLVALSNGSKELTAALLGQAGLAHMFAAVRSTDEVEASKPDSRVYAMAREHAPGRELWLVAAHAWDVAGAARAGLRGAWVSSVEGIWLDAYPPPEVIAGDLAAAARKILRISG